MGDEITIVRILQILYECNERFGNRIKSAEIEQITSWISLNVLIETITKTIAKNVDTRR